LAAGKVMLAGTAIAFPLTSKQGVPPGFAGVDEVVPVLAVTRSTSSPRVTEMPLAPLLSRWLKPPGVVAEFPSSQPHART